MIEAKEIKLNFTRKIANYNNLDVAETLQSSGADYALKCCNHEIKTDFQPLASDHKSRSESFHFY